MATVLRKGRLRVMVYSRDHPPPHVHVITPAGKAKILVEGNAGHPELVWNFGLARRELATALALIDRHKDLILEQWRRNHEQSGLDPH